MSRTRSLSGLVAFALAAGALVATTTAGGHADSSTSAVAGEVPTEPMRGYGWIQGSVSNGAATDVQGITVTATPDGASSPAASWITYEGIEGGGEPGWFRLYRLEPGDYRVTVTDPEGRFAPVRSGSLTVRGGRITELDVPLLRVTTTAGQLRRSTITARDRGRVAVTVTSVKPTGKVLVKEGRQTVGSTTLRGADRGAATITLDRLGKGSHDLKAVYAGSSLHAPSTSKKFTLTVKKPKRKRPNARVWPR